MADLQQCAKLAQSRDIQLAAVKVVDCKDCSILLSKLMRVVSGEDWRVLKFMIYVKTGSKSLSS